MKPLNNSNKEMTKSEKFFLVLGGIFFCVILVFVLIQEGFQLDSSSNAYPVKKLFTEKELWFVNIGLGCLGGFLMRPKNHIISALCGIIAGLAITWVSFLYFGWRDSMIKAEIVIPLFVGLVPGAIAYKLVCKYFKRAL